jgi:hypothetical protein
MTFTNKAEKKTDENNNNRPWYKNYPLLGIILATTFAIIVTIIAYALPYSSLSSDFSLSLNPMSGAVQAGGVIQTLIDVKSINEYDFTVSLSANGQPSGMVFTFGPPFGEAKPSYTSTITINVDQSVSPGIYKIEIKGTGANGKEHNCIYTLTVNPTSTPTSTPTDKIDQYPPIEWGIMETYFDINDITLGKTEYTDVLGRVYVYDSINFSVEAKTNFDSIIMFEAEFYDEDGIKVYSSFVCFDPDYYQWQPGDRSKGDVELPSTSDMEKVRIIKISPFI